LRIHIFQPAIIHSHLHSQSHYTSAASPRLISRTLKETRRSDWMGSVVFLARPTSFFLRRKRNTQHTALSPFQSTRSTHNQSLAKPSTATNNRPSHIFRLPFLLSSRISNNPRQSIHSTNPLPSTNHQQWRVPSRLPVSNSILIIIITFTHTSPYPHRRRPRCRAGRGFTSRPLLHPFTSSPQHRA
jgi:hypothetical protein